VAHHARRLGRAPRGISLRDPRARWGSCSADGNLMFSWRLALAPSAVLDYVVAHEVAHLAELNHSSRFWAEVGRLCPGYEAQRVWLRRHGPDLHAFDFAATPA
jgi:predicted metal-dependent hydrolase